VLRNAYAHYPAGTVHLSVVDPGVGGTRRPLVVEVADQWFVGPDNGLFAPILKREVKGVVRHVQREELFLKPVSNTFHGRDLFAPVAAYLASGGEPETLGPVIDDWISLELPRPQFGEGEILGQIIYVDRFGNGITNIHRIELIQHLSSTRVEIFVGDYRLEGIHGSYGDVSWGQTLALFGSSEFLEISIHGGNAQRILGLRQGESKVLVRMLKGPSCP
jgi:S-adenosylmethionine hydrolase